MPIFLLPEGNTEREFLANFESIVRKSLPHEKLKGFYHDPEVAKLALLNKVTFCSERIKVTVMQLIILNLEFNNNYNIHNYYELNIIHSNHNYYELVNNENCMFKYLIFFYLFSSILKISFHVVSS